jgi:hypothetical protein
VPAEIFADSGQAGRAKAKRIAKNPSFRNITPTTFDGEKPVQSQQLSP